MIIDRDVSKDCAPAPARWLDGPIADLMAEGHRASPASSVRRWQHACDGRILSFDLAASGAFAALMARARLAGRSIGSADGYSAAIAAKQNFIVVTRDTGPFEAAGLRTIDPGTELA